MAPKEFQQRGTTTTMYKPLLKKIFSAIAALFIATLVLPQQAQAQEQVTYELKLAGMRVTSLNCNDLSSIDGVSGTAKFDPESKTLTLDNATISTSVVKFPGLENAMDGLTIHLIGNNTITSEGYWGLFNNHKRSITLTGSGKLTVNGSTMVPQVGYQRAIFNWGTIVVDGCTLEANGGVYGIGSGYWKFINCNVRTKGGGGSQSDEYAGSLTWMWDKEPEFVGCKITSPAGVSWKKFQNNGYDNYVLVGEDGNAVTDWVEITRDNTGVNAPNTEAATAKRGIYTLQGLRLSGELKDLPAGIYIVDGKKVVKP